MKTTWINFEHLSEAVGFFTIAILTALNITGVYTNPLQLDLNHCRCIIPTTFVIHWLLRVLHESKYFQSVLNAIKRDI